MRHLKSFLICIFSIFVGSVWATPETLPDGARVTCVKNDDGTGTVTVTGVEVQKLELYVHAPNSELRPLSPAASYRIPASTTFNFIWKNKSGEPRYVSLGGEEAQVSKVFASSSAKGGQFDGVMVVSDAKHGGIGHGGSSMGCTHMLRPKK